MDQFNWDVVIRLATQGAKGSVADLNRVSEAQDRLNREGKITEKGLEQNTRAINRYSQSAGSARSSNDGLTASTNSLRYANYDLATTLFTVSAAFTAAGAASVIAFASQEKAFTSVERIVSGSSDQIKGLRAELQALSTEIPVSFNELSNIASLGAALDIPAQSLAAFTEVVAKFAATTGTTVEAAAEGFGRLAAYFDLDPTQFDALGSAILRAGNVSIATEEQVLKYAQALSIAGSRAGFTAEQTVALGAGIASFGRINVEGAGSALSRITAQIDEATSVGGEKLEKFAAISGMSAQQFQTAWGSDSFSAFQSLLKGLSGLDDANLVLKEIGINNERDSRTILALTQNYGKFNQILGDTTSAWREGTYMNEAYGLVLDDLNSKWIIFTNAVTNAAAAVGSSAAPALGQLLQITTDLLVNFAAFAQSDLGQTIIGIAARVLALIAAWAAFRGILALATASALAFRTATAFIGGGGIAKGILGMATALNIYTPAANGAASASWNLRAGLTAIARATVVLGVIQFAIGLLWDFNEAMYSLAQPVHFVIDLFYAVRDTIVSAAQTLSYFIGLIPGAGVFAGFAEGLSDYQKTLKGVNSEVHSGVDNWFSQFKKADEATYGLNNTAASGIPIMEELGTSGMDSLGGIGDGAAAAAKEVRTLTDYANDLSSVWSRAFDIRFSGGSTQDAITQTFIDMREAADEAARSVSRLQAEISGLNSDINIQQRFLAVAIEYKDADRAQAIMANIEKLQSDLADKNAELTDAQTKNSKALTGNSKAAIANRTQILGLVEQYQAHVQALADSGMGQAELAFATQRLRQDFINQATQLGYNEIELQQYAAAFDDVSLAISRVPRNITVATDINPAITALNELEARAQATASSIGNSIGGALGGIGSNVGTGLQDRADYAITLAKATALSLQATLASLSGDIWGATNYNLQAATQRALANAYRARGGFAGGGFTGMGGMYEPAGIVHRGEYVIPKRDVNQRTGLPYSDALGRLQRGTPGRSSYAGGGFANNSMASSGHIASFGPMAQQQLMSALRQVVTLDGEVISTNSAKNYARGTNEGAY